MEQKNKEVRLNYPPVIAVKAVEELKKMVDSKPEATQEQKAIYADIQTLVELAFSILKADPTESGNKKQ